MKNQPGLIYIPGEFNFFPSGSQRRPPPMKTMNREVALMLEELLRTDLFQQALNEASLNIGMPIENFDELKEHLPEGKPWTIENVNLALQNYRANTIVETRKVLTDLYQHLKTKPEEEIAEPNTE